MHVRNESEVNLSYIGLLRRSGAVSYLTASVVVASLLTLLRPTGALMILSLLGHRKDAEPWRRIIPRRLY